MIQSASTSALRAEYLRRLADKPYFAANLGTHLNLFGQHPASGWAFYLLPGSAVLELRGGSAVLCGELPGGDAGGDAREELRGFLQFLHADTLRSEHPLALDGWRLAAPLALWELPRGRTLPLPPAPPAVRKRRLTPKAPPSAATPCRAAWNTIRIKQKTSAIRSSGIEEVLQMFSVL